MSKYYGKKYCWEAVQAAEFVDGSVVIEKGKYLGTCMAEVISKLNDEDDNRNDDGYVGSKILGIKICGLEM